MENKQLLRSNVFCAVAHSRCRHVFCQLFSCPCFLKTTILTTDESFAQQYFESNSFQEKKASFFRSLKKLLPLPVLEEIYAQNEQIACRHNMLFITAALC